MLNYDKPQDIAAVAGIFVLVGRLGWSFMSLLWHYGSERVAAKVRSRSLDLGPFEAIPRGAKLRCLVVRYGTDESTAPSSGAR